MKLDIKNWSGSIVGDIELSENIFNTELRSDIIARVIRWQLAKRRSGNHKTKEIGDVSGTTKKPWKQKGTGRARAGSLRSPQFRGGAVIFGPVVRDHSFSLQKKVRRLGLLSALSEKLNSDHLIILDSIDTEYNKTKEFVKDLETMNVSSALIVGSKKEITGNISLVSSNLHKINIIESVGLNVYDIVRHKHLIISVDSIKYFEERFEK